MTASREAYFETQPLFTPGQRGPFDCQYRIPNLIVSRAGTVFAFASEKVGRISDEAKGNFIVRRSHDGGRTWTAIEPLRQDEDPRVSYGYSSGVADLETGRVLVFFGTGVTILPEDIGGVWPEKWKAEHPEEAAELAQRLAPHVQRGRYLTWTDDEGATWAEPVPVGDALRIANPVTGERRPFGPQWVGTQLRYGPHKGRLVLPGRGLSQGAPFALFGFSHNCVIYSDDHGQTWQPGGLTQTGTGEACLVEQADGTLYVNSRNESLRFRGYRAWDRSDDGGESFIASGYDPGLPEPHCQASMVRLSGPPDRSRVLFCNPAVHSDTTTHFDIHGRRNLTVRLSTDECRTWPVARTVCEGGAAYSSLAVTADGGILCAYETVSPVEGRLNHDGQIVLARFNLPWLLDGQPEP